MKMKKKHVRIHHNSDLSRTIYYKGRKIHRTSQIPADREIDSFMPGFAPSGYTVSDTFAKRFSR